MGKSKSIKKELTAAQREELIRILKARFEKKLLAGKAGISRHKDIKWDKVQAKLEANPGKLWSLNEMEKLAVNPMLLDMTTKLVNTFFMIAPQKVLPDAEVFVMIKKLWKQGRNTNQKIALLIWPKLWELNC